MKQVTAYLADDQSLHRTEEEALNHDRNIAWQRNVRDWVAEHFCVRDNTAEDVVSFLLEFGHEIDFELNPKLKKGEKD